MIRELRVRTVILFAFIFLLGSFAFASPAISSISPTVGPVSPVGAALTINGSGFGTTQDTITIGGVAAVPNSWTDTKIVAPVPSSLLPGFADVVVTVSGAASNAKSFLVIPVITAVSPANTPIGGTVTVTGTSFGDTQGAGSTVTLNGVTMSPSAWNNTSVSFPVPVGASSGGIVVTINGWQTNSVNYYIAPTITALSPSSGPIGGSITITGSAFGAVRNFNPVTIGGISVTPTSWSDTAIAVPVPTTLPAGNANVIVTVNAVASNAVSYTVTPAITSISPASGFPGTQVTITGTGFGATQGQVTIGQQQMIIDTWSDTSVVATVPADAITGNLVLTTNGTLASNFSSFTVNHGGPLLQLSVSDAPLRVNLTSPQVLDWIHWGRISASVPDRKDGIAPLIGDYTAFNGALPSASSGNIAFSWTDGNHPAVVSEANEDVETFNTGSGFQITVPADTAAKTLNLYAEVFFGQAVLQATLSDGSATAISDQSVIDSDVGSKVYSIDFRAASPGQTLTVTFASAATPSGGVGLQAATLTPHLPVVGVASPLGGQSFTTASVVPVSVNASQLDSSINDVKATNSDSTVLESSASPLNANLGPLAGGHYSIAGTATDTTALIGTSAPVEFDVIGQGGTLSIQENVPSSPVDLDVQGNADWVLWGPVNTGDTLFDLPGFILARKASVAPLIAEYKPIGNHFITSQAFAHSLCFSGDQQNYCSGSEITVHGKGNGFEITVAADTTPRTLQLYVGTLAAGGIVTAFLSDGSAPVATEVGGSGPPQANTTLYTINYSAASSGQTLTVRFTLNTDLGDGQVTLIGAAVNGSSSGSLGPAPQITGISPNPAPANTKVTIAGTNFGSSQGQGSVYFGEVTAQVVNWSDTSIDVFVPGFLQPANTVQVGVVTANGASNLISFSTPIYKISPQNIAMIVGQSRTVSVTDANGNRVTGLGWSTDDLAIVSLSTDDPPVITALAPGQATVWAGDVSFPITVYAADSVPPGTPLWSLPVSSGGAVMALVPAVPSDSGADVFSLDDGGTLTAVSSDGTPVWKLSGVPSPSTATIIPDFSGNALLKTSFSFTDAQANIHTTHKIQQATQGAGQLTDLYTYTDQQTGVHAFDDSASVQGAIPHPGGMLFLHDNTTIRVIDPTGVLPPANVTLDNSTVNGQPIAPMTGKMIVAGDSNAYVPYVYREETDTSSGPQSSTTHVVTHSVVLRASPDGSSAKTELQSWTYDQSCVPWTPPNHTSADGIQCTSSGPTPSVAYNSAITNADAGVAVFTTTVLVGCTNEFYSSPGILDHETGCGDTLAHTELTYVAQDAVTSQIPNAVVLPNDSGRVEAFVPALQREDGSYIGTDTTSIIFGYSNLLAVGSAGSILWKKPVNTTPTFITPLYATADGGVIVTSKQVQNCQPNPDRCDTVGTPTQYTLDQSGSTSSQTSDTGAKLSWTGRWYGSPASLGIARYSLANFDLALSFWPELDGNLSGSRQPPTLLMTHMYPVPLESTGVSADQIKVDTRRAVPLNPKTDLPVTHTFLLGEDLSTVAFREAIEETSQAVGYIGHSINVAIQLPDGTQGVVPFGLFMGTRGIPKGGGESQNIHLVIAPNPAPPPGLGFLVPDQINKVYIDGVDIKQNPMQPRANVIFLGSCGSFSLPYQYWFNINSTTKKHVLLVPTDADFTGNFLEVPGGVARFEWTLIAQDLAKGKTVAAALDAANQTIHVPGLFKNPDGTIMKVSDSFKWVAVGDSSLRLRPTSK